MKVVFIAIVSVLFALGAFAQHNHYIYIQSDNKQQFTVAVNNSNYTSSSSGHLIIPKLLLGNYSLKVSFPNSEWPAQFISVAVNGDAGYTLKNFGEKGWGLFNLQSMAVVMNENEVKKETPAIVETPKPVENQSEVKKETTITETNIQEPEKKEIVVEEKPVTEKSADTVLANNKKEEVSPVASAKPIFSIVKQQSFVADTDGIALTYIVQEATGNDTIKVFLPGAELLTKEEQAKPIEQLQEKVVEVKQPENTIPQPEVTKPVEKTEVAKVAVSTCKNNATEKDFLKLRKKMAEETSSADMVVQAQKGFKSTCFTTEQIKNLSVLFLTDDGRYQFLKAAYGATIDKENFSSLSSIFIDQSYVNKFNEIIQ